MKNFIRIFFILLAAACNQNNSQEMQSRDIVDTTAFQRTLNVPNREVVLVPEAREITMDWLAYLTAQSEIENFNNYTVEDIISNASPIAEIMENLRQTLPKELHTNAVQTRLSVLYTKARVLEHLSERRRNRPEEIAATAEELPVEFNNFKIQLNEVFLESLEDFEQGLEDMEEEEDTIPAEEPLLQEADTVN